MNAPISNDSDGRMPAIADPFDLDAHEAFTQWAQWKRTVYPQTMEALVVPIQDPCALTSAEHDAVLAACRTANMAIYTLAGDADAGKPAIRDLGLQFGLQRLDCNLGADEDSITSLRVVKGDRRTGYIPYTNRRLSWHTDGYYNPLDRQIRAAIMHCVTNAAQGGANALVDHEMVYLQMREENPAFITALMAPDAMTIPPNVEAGAEIRGAQTGPVFSVDPQTGALHMRYSARTRNIEWKQDAITRDAADMLVALMDDDAPYVFKHRLEPGQGIICNNVLHCRTAFEDDVDAGQQRLLYRARYYDRIAGTGIADCNWQVN